MPLYDGVLSDDPIATVFGATVPGLFGILAEDLAGLNFITFDTGAVSMSTPKFAETSRPMDFLIFEEDHLHSRENVTIDLAADWLTAAAAPVPTNGELVIKSGTVVALKAGAKNVVIPADPADITDKFYGVIVEEVCAIHAANAGIRNRGVVIRRNATFKDAGLLWVKTGVHVPLTDPQDALFLVELQKNGCSLRHVVGSPDMSQVSELG
jgi:hypothetical protein